MPQPTIWAKSSAPVLQPSRETEELPPAPRRSTSRQLIRHWEPPARPRNRNLKTCRTKSQIRDWPNWRRCTRISLKLRLKLPLKSEPATKKQRKNCQIRKKTIHCFMHLVPYIHPAFFIAYLIVVYCCCFLIVGKSIMH